MTLAEHVLYDFYKLRVELDNRGVVGWGLGKHNRRELEDQTKLKVVRDVGILVKETSP